MKRIMKTEFKLFKEMKNSDKDIIFSKIITLLDDFKNIYYDNSEGYVQVSKELLFQQEDKAKFKIVITEYLKESECLQVNLCECIDEQVKEFKKYVLSSLDEDLADNLTKYIDTRALICEEKPFMLSFHLESEKGSISIEQSFSSFENLLIHIFIYDNRIKR